MIKDIFIFIAWLLRARLSTCSKKEVFIPWMRAVCGGDRLSLIPERSRCLCLLKWVSVERGFEVGCWGVMAKPHSLRLHAELCGKLLPVIIFGQGWSFSSGLVLHTQKHFSPLSVMWSLCLGRKPRTVSHSVLSFQACVFCLSLVLFLTLSDTHTHGHVHLR